jgi:hypothetical protein
MNLSVNPTTLFNNYQGNFVIAMVVMITICCGSVHANDSLKLTDTILVQKQQVSRKHGIKLYPDATHQVLFFGAKGIYGKVYQLFIFDVEGKLVKQVNIKNKQTTVLDNIEKGDYLFEVFSDDERIENGQVIVR